MRTKLACLLMFCLMVFAPWAAAQSGKGAITGRVTDPTGGVIPSAKVTITNTDTSVSSELTTNGDGYFQALSLMPGNYRIEVRSPNFKTLVRDNLVVQAEDQIGLDLRLFVGDVNEKVVVTAESPQLRTEDAQLGEVVTNSMLETLPSNNAGGIYRDPLLLLTLSGDVQGSGARAGTGLGIGLGGPNSGQADTRINGGRTGSIEYYVDGVPATTNTGHNVSVATPAYEDVQEFKVVTNGLSAEYGRLSGGAVSITTKSGTDGFHGQLFEFNQQPFYNANSWQNDASDSRKSSSRINDFGVAAGGPVLLPHLYDGRGKTFWYANYEGVRNPTNGNAQLISIPTTTERTGNLSDYGVAGSASNPTAQVWDPFAGSSYPNLLTTPGGTQGYQRTTNLGNVIPTADLDPTVQAYMSLLPAPNNTPIPGSAGGNNYKYFQPGNQHINLWGIRVDQVITSNQRLFFHLSHTDWFNETGYVIPSVPSTYSTDTNGGFAPTLGYQWNINPTTFLELHVGGNFSPYSTGNQLPSSFNNSAFKYSSQIENLLGTHNIVGLNGIDDQNQNVPGANAGGSYGFNGASSQRFNSTNAQFSAMLTKILGRHSLKFGYEGRRYYDNFYNSSSTTMFVDAEAVGPYSNYDQSWSPQGNANGLGQFLLGVDSWLQIASPYGRNMRMNYYASFVQDDFKVTSRLTLNLGLRWETESPLTEKNNLLTIWDPTANPGFVINPGYNFGTALTNAGLNPSQVVTPSWVNGSFAPGAIRIPGTQEHPSNDANDWHPWNFAPRIGAAYQLDPKTVLRASYAILYLPTSGSLQAFAESPGINYTAQANSQPQQALGYTVSVPETGLQNLQMPFVNPAVEITEPTRDNLTANYLASNLGQTSSGAVSKDLHMPMESDWSFGIQHQLPWDVLVQAEYVGNHSSSLLAKDTPSRFPISLYTGGPTGQNAQIYQTQVANPFAGQGPNNTPTVALGSLEMLWPYFGLLQVQGVNAGTSNFNALNFRAQKRFSNGFQFLFNYTYSHLIDDVGGSDSGLGSGPAAGYGASGVVPQSVESFRSTYSSDPSDQTHRISAFYDYQLPVGRGRKYLASPSSIGEKLLDGFIGGWEVSGNTVWHSGTPIVWNFPTTNQGSYGIFQQYLSLAPGMALDDLINPGFYSANQARIGPNGPGITSISAFNHGAVVLDPNTGKAPTFTYGTIPDVYTHIRNPGSWNSNLSVLKNFPVFSSDGGRYLQFRMEGLNIFNHPGLGGYDSNFADGNFGYITGTANQERHIQLALKFVF